MAGWMICDICGHEYDTFTVDGTCPRGCQENAKELQGKKFDEDKLRMDLLPVKPLQDIAEILTFGAKKYGDRNWEEGIEWSRIYAALQRHLMAFWGGEDADEETGKSHLAHAGCCVMFLLEFEKTHPELDNRPKKIKEV